MLSSCRHRLHLDRFDPAAAGLVESLGVRQRRDAALAYREQVRARLAAAAPDLVQIDPELSVAQRAAATLAACAAGADRIWGGLLPSDPTTGRRGGAELLLRDTAHGGYRPVIVVNHKVTDPIGDGAPPASRASTSSVFDWDPQPDHDRKVRPQQRDQLRLSHVYRMLQDQGLASPAAVGGVIGYGSDRVLVHDLTPVLPEYDRRLADRLAVARGQLRTEPSRVGECRDCSWWPRCSARLTELRDVSLVAPGSRADVLRAVEVRTVDELARYTGAAPPDWQYGAFDETVVTARAWLAGIPLIRRVERVAVHRADVEVDVDLESYQEHGAYLWGALYQDRYLPFVTWDPLPTADEGRSFAEFWTWLIGVRQRTHAAGRTFAAYCYSRTAEDRWMYASARRFAGRAGVPDEAEVRAFVDGPDWVDMYQAVNDQFICPQGKGLKKVAPVAGFAWRDPEAGGEASMQWYRAAVGYAGPDDPGQRRRLLEYNEDDVRATRRLREWMSEQADISVPFAGDLGPPS
ncbi:TM0106 family RecB-like putative nuclease [Skermania piniformis]|uniref:TM0106 family RecB-like putative nuclease n=1 Tax=Skermania pinensis TaxID=39122 RepID=A0ABX8SF38_9ACTN|nr:TM0106 family RecB-like putative nuclease [Skermania piniformis]QXQ15574.1 TM0106 family RecB-like putative nuclease [Skermania piniformis]